MLAAARACILPAIRLYLLGLKVLLVQLFSSPFRLPGQLNTFSHQSQRETERLLPVFFVVTLLSCWLSIGFGSDACTEPHELYYNRHFEKLSVSRALANMLAMYRFSTQANVRTTFIYHECH